MQEVVSGPPVGKFTTTHLRRIEYGPDSIDGLWDILKDVMQEYASKGQEGASPKVLIMTGNSLSKTPVVPHVEKLLKDRHAYAATFTGMKQHAPIANIEEALKVYRDNDANCIVGIGGGSVIDAAKLVSYFHNEQHGSFIPHVRISK
jgi:alcohol dehydrogenase class IV